MQYHFSFDYNDISKLTNIKVYHNNQLIYDLASSVLSNLNFQICGDERAGFDLKAFLKNTNEPAFQYIDQDGEYCTVTIYDHNPQYKHDLLQLYGNLASDFTTEILHNSTVELELEHVNMHSEFDFTIA